jgi:hypothetical protein
MLYFPPGREPAHTFQPSEVIPALRESLNALASAMKTLLWGARFDGDPRYAESREIESFRLEQAVESARSRLRGWVGYWPAGFGRYPQCLRAIQRAVVLLLTCEPFGGGEFEELPVISLATEDNLRELTDILEELATWQGETPERQNPPHQSESNPQEALPPPPQPRPKRGTLDERAAIELTKNPALTYDQLAKMLGCRPGTLRDKRKCPLLAAAKAKIRASRQDFQGNDTWRDRDGEDE